MCVCGEGRVGIPEGGCCEADIGGVELGRPVRGRAAETLRVEYIVTYSWAAATRI